jgi:hypothetical protein
MSNMVRGPSLRGVIFQGNRIVGGLDLPTPSEAFIEQFNREYAALGLQATSAEDPRIPNANSTGQTHSGCPDR